MHYSEKNRARQRDKARKMKDQCSTVPNSIVRDVLPPGFPKCGKSNVLNSDVLPPGFPNCGKSSVLNSGERSPAVQVASSDQTNIGAQTLLADHDTRAVEPVQRLGFPSLDLSRQSGNNPLRLTQTEAVPAALRQAVLLAAVRLHSHDPRRVVAKGRVGVVRARKPDDDGDA